MNKPLVIGLGNRMRGDDAVGPLVIEALAKRSDCSADFIHSAADTMTLVDGWQQRDLVLLVDACQQQSLPAGEITLIEDAMAGDMADLASLRTPCSSHTLDIRQAIEMSQALQCAPKQLCIYAVAAKSFEAGSPPSAAVNDAIAQLVALLSVRLNAAHNQQ